MKHKPINKKIRDEVYRKYGGHCAYCGCDLLYGDMQVDHIRSLYWKSIDNGYVDNPDVVQDDGIENLMPSCRQCNFYKGEYDIEGFRSKMKNMLERTCRDSFQVRLAMKYGILKYEPWDGVFYFESVNK